jgi:SNF2 family DNA or RNA helicase
MLDIIENDLLKKHLPGVSYLRLDGSVPANMRHEIVANFNNDPSIDILLLTTQVSLRRIHVAAVSSFSLRHRSVDLV